MNDKLLTTKEVANTLRVTTRTIHNYLNAGKIKGIKLGGKILIRESELDKFIKSKERV